MAKIPINSGLRRQSDIPCAAGKPRLRRIPDRRVQIINFVLACAWPFLAAAAYVVSFSRHRAYTAFVIFCVAAGWSYAPTIGSDGHFAAVEIERLKAGMPLTFREPAISALIYLHAKLGLSESFYFAILGLFYGLAVSWCGKLLLSGRPRSLPIGRTATIFSAGFFLFYPVFAALNARYTLGMWIMFAATLLALQGRWRYVSAVGLAALSFHYGHAMFAAALALLWASRYLGKWQLVSAYALAVTFAILPDGILIAIGSSISSITGGSFGEAVNASVSFAERVQQGEISMERDWAWYRLYFTDFMFYSLIVSGHYLAWNYLKTREDPLYQLWTLIILMWAAFFFMGSEPIGQNRMQRNMTGLMLMWHAAWFLRGLPGALPAKFINIVPMAIFLIVGYRIWLHQANVGAFLPFPWLYWEELWPRVMELLGFD